jgi:hypothetical protein
MIKLYFGGDALPFGLPPAEPSLDAYPAMLDGSGLRWLVAVLGGDVVGCGLAALALERGGPRPLRPRGPRGRAHPAQRRAGSGGRRSGRRLLPPHLHGGRDLRAARLSSVTLYVQDLRYGLTASTDTLVTP